MGKQHFDNIKNAGTNSGFGLDAFILLEEKIDLRVRVEATLSHLFDRRIHLEWQSGFLKPKAILTRQGTSYDIKSGECHGIKEMMILLTHLYNDDDLRPMFPPGNWRICRFDFDLMRPAFAKPFSWHIR